ncbi:MAG TPA: NAD(P)-binding domain-containing protein [Vicinamibacterales bacterium]|nr:NAD(P)-binding domain-containing protein [Vicinamibacterales bacterium]
MAERHEVIVIGGGQAGLSVGYHLQREGVPFVILDASARIGDAWRERWDSLRLFTPRRFDGLDGMTFPGVANDLPTKDEMADYLESYATRFRLPVRTGTRVDRLCREGGRYLLEAGGRRLEARQVVVAMSSYQRGVAPPFAGQLDPAITQLHSADYRRPSQLPPGDVLLVGAGNSGAEIAIDLARDGRRVWLSGRDVGQVPFPVHRPLVRRLVLPILFRVVFHHILTLDTPIGRKVRPGFINGGMPLIRTRNADLAAAGVTRVPRMDGVSGGYPRLADGTITRVSGVVWCTGFDMGRSWIDLPVFDAHGEPIQERGVVPGEPGLYFVGPHFLYSASSTMIHGIGRDARHVAKRIAAIRRDAGRALAMQ